MIPPMTSGRISVRVSPRDDAGRIWYPELLLLTFPSRFIGGASALPSAEPTRAARIVGRELGELSWTGRADTMFRRPIA